MEKTKVRKADLIKKIREMNVTGPIVDGDRWGDLPQQTFVMGELNMIGAKGGEISAFDCYNESGTHPGGVYYKLKKLLERCGWTFEAYDAGTFIICPESY